MNMEWIESLGASWPTWVALSLIMLGLVGTLLPVLPGNIILVLGIWVHFFFAENPVGLWFVIIATAMAVLAQIADALCTLWGVRRYGASWRGAVGAFVGGLVGIFLPPPVIAMLLGTVLGAILGELSGGRLWREATRAGYGSIVGAFVAFIVKLSIAAISALCFVYLII